MKKSLIDQHEALCVVAVSSFVLGCTATLIVISIDAIKGSTANPVLLITPVATFFSAYFAFALNRRKEREGEKTKEILALSRAMFILQHQKNALELMKQQLIRQSINGYPAIETPAVAPPTYDHLLQDMASLVFLIDINEAAVLTRVIDAQEYFNQTIRAIEERCEFYANTLIPHLERENCIRNGELIFGQIPHIKDDLVTTRAEEMLDQISKLLTGFSSRFEYPTRELERVRIEKSSLSRRTH